MHLHAQAHASSDITNMTNQDVQKYIFEVRQSNAYASEAYSFNLGDTTGEHVDILLGSIPETKSILLYTLAETKAGVTGEYILALLFESKKWALNSLPVIGHCTDSASNALSALIMLATPSTYSDLRHSTIVYQTVKSSLLVLCPYFLPTLSYNCLPLLGPLRQDSEKESHE